jgi:hypothetical protein
MIVIVPIIPPFVPQELLVFFQNRFSRLRLNHSLNDDFVPKSTLRAESHKCGSLFLSFSVASVGVVVFLGFSLRFLYINLFFALFARLRKFLGTPRIVGASRWLALSLS